MGAPTAKLETVVVVSPLKVLSTVSAGIAIIFLIVALPTSFWIHADSTTRYGIWKNCEFNETDITTVDCYVTNKVWVQISGSLIIACVVCAGAGVGLVLAGFKHEERQERRSKFYQTAGIVFLIGIISVLLALILFPLMLRGELARRQKDNWYFGWSYGLAWGAAIFLAAALGLLVYDRNREEIFYKEKLYLNQEEDEENRMVDQEAKIKTLN